MKRPKAMILLRKTNDRTEDEFFRRVRDYVIPRLIERCGDSVDGLTINRVEEMNFRGGMPTNAAGHIWSAIVEVYFSREADMLPAITDAILPTLNESEDILFDNAVVPVTEIMMYDNLTSPDPVKIFGLFHITGGLTRSEVHRYWHGPHAEMGLQLKADTIIRKYSQNHTLLDYVAPDPRYRYDGASIAYFDTVEDAGKIYRNPAVLDVAEADELLMGTEPAAVVSIAVREEIVFDRNGSHST